MDILSDLEASGTIEILTIVEAALLLPDFDLDDPLLFQCKGKVYPHHQGFMRKICAIYYALLRGEIRGYRSVCDENRSPYFDSSVFTNSAQVWIHKRNDHNLSPKKADLMKEGTTSNSDPLDRENPRFAPKLAASIRAWQSVTDPGLIQEKNHRSKLLRPS